MEFALAALQTAAQRVSAAIEIYKIYPSTIYIEI